jgi:hypothetical protein
MVEKHPSYSAGGKAVQQPKCEAFVTGWPETMAANATAKLLRSVLKDGGEVLVLLFETVEEQRLWLQKHAAVFVRKGP